ncbi:MAG: protein kinase [Planctomycetaceae bacterium]
MSDSSNRVSVDSQRRVDELCDEFEARLRAGHHPEIEHYLPQVAAGQQQSLLCALLEVELELSADPETASLLDDYTKRFPEYTAAVVSVFADFSTRRSPADCFASTVHPGGADRLTDTDHGRPFSQSAGSPADKVVKNHQRYASASRDFGEYELISEIARGGMGVVFRARHRTLDRMVALKMILAGQLAGEEQIQRFYAEAKAAGKLDHPGIVPVYEVGEAEGQHFLSMAFVEGESLAEQIRRSPLKPLAAAQILRAVAEAVQYAHDNQIVHRDLKPANILIDSSGQPRVTDFGLAKSGQDGQGLTLSGDVLGTPGYMPPEQATGRVSEIGPQSDVYSLGAVLYASLTGRPSFQAASVMETLQQVIEVEPVAPRSLNPAIDRDLDTICLKCLEKSPASRYDSAAQLAAECDRYVRGEPIQARRLGPGTRLWRWCRRKPLAAALIVSVSAAVLLLVTGLGLNARLERAVLDANQAEELRLAAEKIAAAEQQASLAEKYVSLLHQIRRKAVTKKWGWTWESLQLLQQAAAIKTPLRDPVELRSLAATIWSSFDIQEIGHVAEDISANAIAFSPDGKRLAVGETKHGLSPTVYVYDTYTQELVSRHTFSNIGMGIRKLFGDGTGVYHDGYRSLAFSADGRWLAGGTRFGRVVCWDTHAVEAEARVCQAFGNDDEVRQLVFSPDEHVLLACSPETQKVCRWSFPDTKTAELSKLTATSIAVLPDAHVLAAIGDGALQLFDLKTLEPLDPGADMDGNLGADEHLVGPLVASPDGRRIVCGGDVAVRIRNPFTGIGSFELQQPDLAPNDIFRISFNAENEVAAMTGRGQQQMVAFVSLRTGQWLGNLYRPEIADAVFSQTGNHLAVRVGRQVTLYSYHIPECTTAVAQLPTPIADIQWNQDGMELICLTDEQPVAEPKGRSRWQQVSRWDSETGAMMNGRTAVTYARHAGAADNLLTREANDSSVLSTLSGPGLWVATNDRSGFAGKPVVTPNNNQYHEIQEDKLIVESEASGVTYIEDRDASDKRALRISQNTKNWKVELDVKGLDLSPEVREWAVFALVKTESVKNGGAAFRVGKEYGSKNTERKIPEAFFSNSGFGLCLVASFGTHHLKVGVRAFLKSIASSRDTGAILVDRFIVVPSNQFDRTEHRFGPICISPGGDRIWSVYNDDQIISLSFPELEVLSKWSNAAAMIISGITGISSLAAGREWCLAGCGDGKLRIVKGEELLKTAHGPGGNVLSIVLAEDERSAIIGTDTGGLRMLSLPDGATIRDLPAHDHAVDSLGLSRNGMILVSGSRDGSVRIWHHQEDGFQLSATLPLGQNKARVRLSPDGRRIAVLDHHSAAVLVWDLKQFNQSLTELGIPIMGALNFPQP